VEEEEEKEVEELSPSVIEDGIPVWLFPIAEEVEEEEEEEEEEEGCGDDEAGTNDGEE
jgi:hypothetical protein